jgi:hypothetical protein
MFAIIGWTGRTSRAFGNRFGVAYAGESGELGLLDLKLSPLHRPVVGMGLEVVLAAGAAEESYNCLTVFSHQLLATTASEVEAFGAEADSTVSNIIAAKITRNGGALNSHRIGFRNYADSWTKELPVQKERIGTYIRGQNFLSIRIIHDQGTPVGTSLAVSDVALHKIELIVLNMGDEFTVRGMDISAKGQSFCGSLDNDGCAIAYNNRDKDIPGIRDMVAAEHNIQSIWGLVWWGTTASRMRKN